MSNHKYDDMIYMPHFVSKDRPHMSLHDRAAQFAPFAALDTFGETIEETGRLTGIELEPGEDELEELNLKFRIVAEHIKELPKITITYFVPDDRKEGGSYETETFNARVINLTSREIVSTEKKKYLIDYVVDIRGEIIDEVMKGAE